MADLQQGAKKLNSVETPSESKTSKNSGVDTDDEAHRSLGKQNIFIWLILSSFIHYYLFHFWIFRGAI